MFRLVYRHQITGRLSVTDLADSPSFRDAALARSVATATLHRSQSYGAQAVRLSAAYLFDPDARLVEAITLCGRKTVTIPSETVLAFRLGIVYPTPEDKRFHVAALATATVARTSHHEPAAVAA